MGRFDAPLTVAADDTVFTDDTVLADAELPEAAFVLQANACRTSCVSPGEASILAVCRCPNLALSIRMLSDAAWELPAEEERRSLLTTPGIVLPRQERCQNGRS